jgi:acetylornithine deacetylase/succinyl-diaminopimelate desuccinylase-like protein
MDSLKGIVILFVVLLTTPILGQRLTKEQIKKQTASHFNESLLKFREFLAIPNDGHYPEQIEANLAWCTSTFNSLGFETKVLTSDEVPHLFAQKGTNTSKKSVLFYMQIDGQPVDRPAWNQPDPFEAMIKDKNERPVDWINLAPIINPDFKLFARSASDSKGPAMCLITALQIMQELKLDADYNIKIIMDFQEEMGSPTIGKLVQENRELLSAERLLILDGTRHISNIPTLNYGARGIATITLTVFGAKENLHSGQYGNYAPNPAFTLSRLLASMKAPDGKVLIKGFYDGIIISEVDKQAFALIPEDLPELNK